MAKTQTPPTTTEAPLTERQKILRADDLERKAANEKREAITSALADANNVPILVQLAEAQRAVAEAETRLHRHDRQEEGREVERRKRLDRLTPASVRAFRELVEEMQQATKNRMDDHQTNKRRLTVPQVRRLDQRTLLLQEVERRVRQLPYVPFPDAAIAEIKALLREEQDDEQSADS